MNYSIIFDDSFEKEVKRLSKRYPSLKLEFFLKYIVPPVG